jgi:hypothetical protein
MVRKISPQERFVKIGQEKQIQDLICDQKIHFDKRQYSLKIPKLLLDKIGYEDGDKIRFHLKKPAKIDNLEITYVRGKDAENNQQ